MGSSPLTRGKHDRQGRRARRHGLIPAHAGKTGNPAKAAVQLWAHPRSRGENWLCDTSICVASGSSPLTRGKHGPLGPSRWVIGLIPAHAGKTARTKDTKPKCRAHPRSRGENGTPASARRSRSGSSPLTRGKLHRSARRQDQRRLIPAHAGKTWNHSTTTLTAAAHPRSRGENETAAANASVDAGSSPLTRGKLTIP